jgi:23S rRNA (uracil1939-C5)-methyltransferase
MGIANSCLERPESTLAAIATDMLTRTVSISRLGHLGDGIAITEEGPLFVPLTLPGEKVEVRLDESHHGRGRMDKLLDASPARTAPICQHFGECGGCALQHMKPSAYSGWKREQLRASFAHRGLTVQVEPMIAIKTGTRRRAVFAARRESGQSRFGYHARHSHRIIEIGECPILTPQIAGTLKDLASLVSPIMPPKGEVRIAVTVTRSGLDVALEGPTLRAPALVPLAGPLVKKLGIARLSIAGETILRMADPVVLIDDVEVVLPPLAFLQAVEAAELAMARLVLQGVGKAKKVADLYAGIGTFALRLAREGRVLAVEGSQNALDALGDAGRRPPGRKPIDTLRRDLARMPMSAGELAGFDAVVFDPPRAGAAAQAAELARSRVPRLVAVSCNPATLARDLRILVDGGYRIDKVTPVDQFLYSPHIESVAQLSREK